MNPITRRTFLKQAATATTTLAGLGLSSGGVERVDPKASLARALPWYRRTLRWGQTNITEIDPTCYGIAWWRKQWKRTHTQGVIINAGGIVAYYPSRVPLHRPAERLDGGRHRAYDMSPCAGPCGHLLANPVMCRVVAIG